MINLPNANNQNLLNIKKKDTVIDSKNKQEEGDLFL